MPILPSAEDLHGHTPAKTTNTRTHEHTNMQRNKGKKQQIKKEAKKHNIEATRKFVGVSTKSRICR
jgi:hypothetical protein